MIKLNHNRRRENIKKIIFLAVVIISLVIIYPLNTYAISDYGLVSLTPSKNDNYSSYDYVIEMLQKQ